MGSCVSMASRRQQGKKHNFVPKPKEITLSIYIWTDRYPTKGERRTLLEDFNNLLEAHKYHVKEVGEPSDIGLNARNIKISLKTTEHRTKFKFFKKLREDWFSSICKLGEPFWLESAETPRETFKYKFDDTRQVLQASFFSFGNFLDRGTYIQHWSSKENDSLIENGNIQVEFEHDTRLLSLTYFKNGAPEGFKEVRIEMEFRQLEDYVVVDEKTAQRNVTFYFLLQWPPKVFQGKNKEIVNK